MTDIVDRLMRDKWHISGVDAADAAAEIDRLRQESSNLRAVNTELLRSLRNLCIGVENIGGEHVTGLEGLEFRLEAAYAAIKNATA